MRKLVSMATLGVAGGVAAGLVAFQTPSVAADEGAYQRKDDQPDVVMAVDDEDDDDTFGRDADTFTRDGKTKATRDTRSRDTGDSRSRADNTNSRVTAVSRDRDRSRGDLTKDWTRDGGDKTRDRTKNSTNDRSRNDTRGVRRR
ncbi:hypothetical protein [Nocardioides sp. zg-DK7169]|uniref:hypothetical protein n=1 Tax=Nocardioides sp. zg-DK7169 TaxID=2736600 RepID=UPI001555B7E8|nr:hypothetical protein [Nocardioides sp. zg-DK7169]NPC96546.1 hypothetical protein [Nocardioides sp. zg-DK7169]